MEFFWNYTGLILELYWYFVGWMAGLWGLALWVGFACWQRSSPEAQPCGRVLRLEFFGLALCVGLRVGRGQAKKPSPCGSDYPNLPKFLKFLLRLIILGVQTTPVILHGSNPVTKLKKKSYIYTLLLIIVKILCYKCNIIVYKCNVSRETTTQSTNVTQKGEKKSQNDGKKG